MGYWLTLQQGAQGNCQRTQEEAVYIRSKPGNVLRHTGSKAGNMIEHTRSKSEKQLEGIQTLEITKGTETNSTGITEKHTKRRWRAGLLLTDLPPEISNRLLKPVFFFYSFNYLTTGP